MTDAELTVLQLSIGASLTSVMVLGALQFADLRVTPTESAVSRTPASADALHAVAGDPSTVTLVRQMYRRLGIDPTKTRPSSEALLRRVGRGQPLPRINTLVDAVNRCSLESRLPYGVYDLGRVSGPVELRLGGAGDEYMGIRKATVHLAGRPALFDDRGPFGNPTADSVRTMITVGTTRAMVVVFAPRPLGRDQVDVVLDGTARHVGLAAGGVEEGRQVVPCA